MEKSIKKLVYLLHQIMNDAGFALLSNEGEDTRRFCIEQYNNIRIRLAELDTELGARFEPLPVQASVGMVRVAARDMAGFLIEHLRKNRNWMSLSFFSLAPWFFSSLELNRKR